MLVNVVSKRSVGIKVRYFVVSVGFFFSNFQQKNQNNF